MANPVMAGALLTQGLRADFARIYKSEYEGVMQDLGDIFWMDAVSDKLKEFYAYLESAPYPIRKDKGMVIESKPMKSIQFNVINRTWARKIEWDWEDRQDDQTGSLFDQSRDLGRNWSTLIERIIVGQFIQNSSDNDLLPTVPNSADGSALYISTTRFGSSSGNIVSQTGSTNVQDIITDLYGAVRRLSEFQDTESQPLWSPSALRRGITVIHGSSLTKVMALAAHQGLVHNTIAGSSTTDVQTGAAVSNTIMGGALGINWNFVPTQRITNSALYCFMRGLPVYKRPVFRQIREPFFETFATWENSDAARDNGQESIQFRSREGYGSGLPYATVKIV